MQRDLQVGCSVAHPPIWHWSGIAYANAFELRRYDPADPDSVPERSRAAVVIVSTLNDSAEATDSFLDDLLAEGGAQRGKERLTIDGRRAVRIRGEAEARQLGPGASRGLYGGDPPERATTFFTTVVTYIADGKRLLTLRGTAPKAADPSIVEELVRIQDSVRFDVSQEEREKEEVER